MIGNLFSYTGVLGALAMVAWVAALVVLVIGTKHRSRPRMYLLALGLVCLSAVLARINVDVWFVRIRLDRTDEINNAIAEQEEKAKQDKEIADSEAEALPKGLAATVSFPEDAPEDLVVGGTTNILRRRVSRPEAGTNTIEEETGTAIPAWRAGGRKVRHIAGVTNQTGGVTTNQVSGGLTKLGDEAEGPASMLIGTSEENVIYVKADKREIIGNIERYARMATEALFYLILLAIAWDYSTAFNFAHSRRFPLPLSGSWMDAASAKLRELTIRPDMGGHWLPEPFLTRAIRKGEKVIYFGQKPIWEGKTALWRIFLCDRKLWHVRIPRYGEVRIPLPALKLWRVPILRYGDPGIPKGSEFVFDALWFDRYVPVVAGDDADCRKMMADFLDILVERRRTGARSARTLIIAWDRDEEIDALTIDRLSKLAGDTNLCVFVWSRAQKG